MAMSQRQDLVTAVDSAIRQAEAFAAGELVTVEDTVADCGRCGGRAAHVAAVADVANAAALAAHAAARTLTPQWMRPTTRAAPPMPPPLPPPSRPLPPRMPLTRPRTCTPRIKTTRS